jgi:hypothetical protein
VQSKSNFSSVLQYGQYLVVEPVAAPGLLAPPQLSHPLQSFWQAANIDSGIVNQSFLSLSSPLGTS